MSWADLPNYVCFSQLYAKVSIPDIYLIPIQANNAVENQGISFQFNDMVVKVVRELNARRNSRFSAAIENVSITCWPIICNTYKERNSRCIRNVYFRKKLSSDRKSVVMNF